MNQKLLARLFYGFLVFMVIVALFLLNYQVKQNKKREQTGNNINVVSRVDDADIEKTAQIAKQPIINVSSMDVKTQLVKDDTPVTASVSYLDVYRQLQTAQACRSFFEFWQRKGLDADITSMVRPPLKLYGDANYLSNEKAPLAAGQTEALKSWVYKCHQLWQAYGEF